MSNNLRRPDVSSFNLNFSSIHSSYDEGSRFDSNTDPTNDNEQDEFANEPPLLEDLGIDIGAVKSKLFAVLLFKKPDQEFVQKPDMTGPMVIGTMLGIFLAMVT